FRSDFVAVHSESFALGNSLESRSDFLRVAIREMAHGAFLFEHFLAPRRGASGSGTRRIFKRCFSWLLLRQNCSGHSQCYDPKNHIIPLHDAPSSNWSLSLLAEATLEPIYSLHLRSQFPPLTRHKGQVPL